MLCEKCKEDFLIKVTEEWITLMCKCQCITIYPDTFISKKTKKEWIPNYKAGEGQCYQKLIKKQ